MSSTTRRVTSGRARAAAASHADSISTATAPVRCKRATALAQDQPLARGDRTDVNTQPAARSTPASIDGSSQAVVPVGPRSSLASTTSPGSRSGSSPPQNPAIRTGRPLVPLASWADRAARRGPMPIWCTVAHGAPERTARASSESGASTIDLSGGAGADRGHDAHALPTASCSAASCVRA